MCQSTQRYRHEMYYCYWKTIAIAPFWHYCYCYWLLLRASQNTIAIAIDKWPPRTNAIDWEILYWSALSCSRGECCICRYEYESLASLIFLTTSVHIIKIKCVTLETDVLQNGTAYHDMSYTIRFSMIRRWILAH